MPRATRHYQSLWLGDGGAPGDRRMAEPLQRGATAPGPGLPDAARGGRWRSLRACGQRLHSGWLRRCRQARRHGRKRSVDLCRIRLILHQYLLPRIGRDIGNAAGLSLKSPRFLSSRWGPPQTPRYLNSEWCIREVREFCQVAQEAGRLMVGSKSRVFKIVKTPVDPAESEALPGIMKDTRTSGSGRPILLTTRHKIRLPHGADRGSHRSELYQI